METRNVDVSCFFLVEATGDSEVNDDDADPNMLVADLDDDDDAESSSCEVSDYHSCVSDVDGCEVVETPSSVDEFLVEEEKDMEVEQVHVYQQWNCTKGHAGFGLNNKSCVSVDSTDGSLNEMEKSRLFWEACLAS